MQPNFKYKMIDEQECIFDVVRKKYVVLTKEEWVRQQLIHYLINKKNIPVSLLSVEKQILVGGRKRRYDLVVYKNDIPWMIVECKEETETLHDAVLQQVLSYTSVMKVKFVCLSNGKQVFCYDIQNSSWFEGFPDYE
jgi:hypothetical protein